MVKQVVQWKGTLPIEHYCFSHKIYKSNQHFDCLLLLIFHVTLESMMRHCNWLVFKKLFSV